MSIKYYINKDYARTRGRGLLYKMQNDSLMCLADTKDFYWEMAYDYGVELVDVPDGYFEHSLYCRREYIIKCNNILYLDKMFEELDL